MTLKHPPTLEKSYEALISTVDDAIEITDRLLVSLAELENSARELSRLVGAVEETKR
jgi:vacuolar-type H+-ATPase subunit D/Vma8